MSRILQKERLSMRDNNDVTKKTYLKCKHTKKSVCLNFNSYFTNNHQLSLCVRVSITLAGRTACQVVHLGAAATEPLEPFGELSPVGRRHLHKQRLGFSIIRRII